MATLEVEADVPESRRVTITLPPDTPTGRVRLTVSVADPQPDVLPPYWPPRRPADPGRAAEYDSFQRLLPTLLASHPGLYVAVCRGRVVAAGDRPDVVEEQARTAGGGAAAYVGLALPPGERLVRIGGVRVVDGGQPL